MIDSQYLLLGFLEHDEIICILCLNVIYGHVMCRVLNNGNGRIFVRTRSPEKKRKKKFDSACFAVVYIQKTINKIQFMIVNENACH